MSSPVLAKGLSQSQINRAGKRLAKLRQMLIAGETRLRDLSAEEEERYVKAIRCVEAFRSQHAYPLRMTNANLRHYVRDYGSNANVTQRLKKFPTILDKLSRYPAMPLAKMEDIAGVRAVLPDQDAVDTVGRKLRKNWTVHRSRDYVRDPKPSGYRAVHIIAIKKNVFVEIQLRTVAQDIWANQVEHDSRTLRVDFKSGRGAEAVHDYYVAVSELLAMQESGQEPSHEFMRELIRRYRLAKPYISEGKP
jgi:putative GTP pyrophosphokinase